MKVLYHITGAITFVNEIPWVVEPIYLAQVFKCIDDLLQSNSLPPVSVNLLLLLFFPFSLSPDTS